MKIFDTHCHPQMSQYDEDREEVLQRAFDAEVGLICVGVDLESSKAAIELAGEHEGVWASVGLHPNDNLDEQYHAHVYEELADDPAVVAIGEVGLDYYRTTEENKKHTQRNRFELQLDLAIKLKKPLIIHCRDAHVDMQAILKSRAAELPGGVIHSFTGTYEDAKKYIDLGFCIGFNGIVTFARQYDEAVKNIPLSRILVETDSPYLSPEPHRGKRNEPAYISEVIKQIGVLRNIPDEDVIAITSETAKTLFGLGISEEVEI